MEKAQNNTLDTNLRYERKFVYPDALPEDIITTEVLVNSFCFREIYERRTVNNCYFDDHSMSFYHQNVSGDEKRDKYRLRWYGNDFAQVNTPILEIKKKYGAVGDKLSFPLNKLEISLEKTTSSKLLERVIEASQKNNYKVLTSALQRLKPSLYNSYERRYFLSHCEKFRITIDYNMQFYNPVVHPYKLSIQSASDVVLELKYARDHDKEARLLSQHLRERLSKHSKYVRGVDNINYLQHI